MQEISAKFSQEIPSKKADVKKSYDFSLPKYATSGRTATAHPAFFNRYTARIPKVRCSNSKTPSLADSGKYETIPPAKAPLSRGVR